jgi:hypothetical protein
MEKSHQRVAMEMKERLVIRESKSKLTRHNRKKLFWCQNSGTVARFSRRCWCWLEFLLEEAIFVKFDGSLLSQSKIQKVQTERKWHMMRKRKLGLNQPIKCFEQ